ncbi:MAG: transposase [Clostridiales bacterium]|nr:transposase [Clostridiales bacterium]
MLYDLVNGFIEGCNNRIKVLKRISFSMPRFKIFRR